MSAIAERGGERNPDLLWAGTDDGNLWVTRDKRRQVGEPSGEARRRQWPPRAALGRQHRTEPRGGRAVLCLP